MRNHRDWIGVAIAMTIAAVALLAGCASGGETMAAEPTQVTATVDTDPEDKAARSSLPLLPPGNHVGVHPGFNADNPPALQEEMDKRYAELSAAGMQVSRPFIDWRDLEPELGNYRPEYLDERLAEHSEKGHAIFLSIVTVDSEQVVGPTDLTVADDGYELINDMAFDDPFVVDAYKKVLDWAVPIAEKHGVFAISVFNEPDNRYLEDDPSLLPQVLNFTRAQVEHIHSLSDKIAVTGTLSMGSVNSEDPGVRSMFDLFDIVTVNYGHSVPGDEWREVEGAYVDALVAIAADRPIMIQELMAHSAGPVEFFSEVTPENSASEERQREFFAWFFDRMADNDALRVAFVLQMVDWSPEVANIYRELLSDAGLPELGEAFATVLENLGLLTFPAGRAKPAYDEVLAAVTRFATNR